MLYNGYGILAVQSIVVSFVCIMQWRVASSIESNFQIFFPSGNQYIHVTVRFEMSKASNWRLTTIYCSEFELFSEFDRSQFPAVTYQENILEMWEENYFHYLLTHPWTSKNKHWKFPVDDAAFFVLEIADHEHKLHLQSIASCTWSFSLIHLWIKE